MDGGWGVNRMLKGSLRQICRWLFDLRILGFERFAFQGPVVIMPNHVSFFDAFFLYLFLPDEIWFVVNTDIARNPVVAFALRSRNHVKVDPLNPYSLRTILGVVKDGHPVVIFPEGRISTTGGLMKMYGGLALVAYRTEAYVFPLILVGPEYSKLSRITDKVRSRWFPPVQILVDEPRRLEADRTKSFRIQKGQLGDRLLQMMQDSLFHARQRYYGNKDLFARLLIAANIYGRQKTAARDINGTVTYKRMLIGIHVMAKKINKLLTKEEDTVGVLMPNAIGHVVLLFSLLKLGRTPAILNFSTGTRNVVDCTENAGVRTVFTSRAFVEKGGFGEMVEQLSKKCRVFYLEDVRATVGAGDKLAGLLALWQGEGAPADSKARFILFTSGTEGKPKGVVLSQGALLANIDQASTIVAYTPKDKMLSTLPMFHSFGLMAGTLLPILGGIEVFLYPSPLHYRIIPELAYDYNATLMLGTPTFLGGYARAAHPYDFYSMRLVLGGGEKLTDEVRNLWSEKFGIRVLEGYGVTETSPVLCLNTPLFYKKGTVGRILPGIEWKLEPVPGIEEAGNLLVKGPNLMDGYLRYGEGFVPVDEWHVTGDIVSVDSDGFVTIRARLKRFAKVAGEMVNLQVIEDAALECYPESRHAAATAADGKRGEKIVLFTTSKTLDRARLRAWLLEHHYSALYLPSEVTVLEKIPLLGTGKADYMSLQRMLG